MKRRAYVWALALIVALSLTVTGCGMLSQNSLASAIWAPSGASGTATPVALLVANQVVTATPRPTSTARPAEVSSAPVLTGTQRVDLDALTEDQITALYDAVESLTVGVYERVSPSVVNITARVIQMDFFGSVYPSEGTGSGFVIDKQGHIVTNYHVIEDATTVQVTLLDDTVTEAKIVGTDPLNDLAVLRVDVDESELYPVDMSFDGEVKVGQRAIAIGSPYGLGWTLTEGVVSSVGRPLRLSSQRTIYDVLQTDAAINPGNSGGPLLNSRGQLIGVNTAIRANAENIGFSIPLSTVRRVVPELIENGHYPHPWIGAAAYPLFPELSQGLGLPVDTGLLIGRIIDGGPADKAGLRAGERDVVLGNIRLVAGGDILVSLDGVPMVDNASLSEFLETRTVVGQEIEAQFYRGDRLYSTRMVVGERPQ